MHLYLSPGHTNLNKEQVWGIPKIDKAAQSMLFPAQGPRSLTRGTSKQNLVGLHESCLSLVGAQLGVGRQTAWLVSPVWGHPWDWLQSIKLFCWGVEGDSSCLCCSTPFQPDAERTKKVREESPVSVSTWRNWATNAQRSIPAAPSCMMHQRHNHPNNGWGGHTHWKVLWDGKQKIEKEKVGA